MRSFIIFELLKAKNDTIQLIAISMFVIEKRFMFIADLFIDDDIFRFEEYCMPGKAARLR